MSSKYAIRQQMKDILKHMTPSMRMKKSEDLVKQFLCTPEYCNVQKLAVYINLPEEPNTMLLIEKALMDGKKVFVPKVISADMYMLPIKSAEEVKLWKPNKWGIKEPEQVLNKDLPDIVTSQGGLDSFIVPGLAFTQSGGRLGRGGGYYDRYIAWYMKQCHLGVFRKPYITAFAFSEQIIDYIPVEPHDLHVDHLFVA